LEQDDIAKAVRKIIKYLNIIYLTKNYSVF